MRDWGAFLPGESRLGVFATRPIAANEEITFDYKMSADQAPFRTV